MLIGTKHNRRKGLEKFLLSKKVRNNKKLEQECVPLIYTKNGTWMCSFQLKMKNKRHGNAPNIKQSHSNKYIVLFCSLHQGT
jgi:hypothetical protein